YHREGEYEDARVPGRHLLITDVRPLIIHPRWQALLAQFLHDGNGLARAEAWPRTAVDSGRVEVVVAHHEHRSAVIVDSYQRPQGNRLPLSITDFQEVQSFDALAEISLRLDVHLPDAAEFVELIDVNRTHVGVEGGEHVVECHAHLLGLFAI